MTMSTATTAITIENVKQPMSPKVGIPKTGFLGGPGRDTDGFIPPTVPLTGPRREAWVFALLGGSGETTNEAAQA